MEFLLHILSGAGVGFLIGMTGVGGGSLMTPLLLLFGYPAPIAIGTDLLYASLTKLGGAYSHHQRGNVNWRIVLLLAMGSVPTSLLIHTFLLDFNEQNLEAFETLLTKSLGLMLIVTSIILLSKDKLRKGAIDQKPKHIMHVLHQYRSPLTFFMGILLGICVTLSSVGAGAFCAAILLTIYSKTPSVKIIGTDIAHAVPLTFIAGLGYLVSGYVDMTLLGSLLLGSLPAIHMGTRVSSRVPDAVLQKLLVGLLLALGTFYCLR